MKTMKTMAITFFALCALTATTFAAEAQTPATAQDTAAQISAKLTEEDALAAALKDAGEAEADITVKQNQLSEKKTQSGETIAVYTVKFGSDSTAYRYFVDANTGEILNKNIQYHNPDVVLDDHVRGEKESGSRGGKRFDSQDTAPAKPETSMEAAGGESQEDTAKPETAVKPADGASQEDTTKPEASMEPLDGESRGNSRGDSSGSGSRVKPQDGGSRGDAARPDTSGESFEGESRTNANDQGNVVKPGTSMNPASAEPQADGDSQEDAA